MANLTRSSESGPPALPGPRRASPSGMACTPAHSEHKKKDQILTGSGHWRALLDRHQTHQRSPSPSPARRLRAWPEVARPAKRRFQVPVAGPDIDTEKIMQKIESSCQGQCSHRQVKFKWTRMRTITAIPNWKAGPGRPISSSWTLALDQLARSHAMLMAWDRELWLGNCCGLRARVTVPAPL